MKKILILLLSVLTLTSAYGRRNSSGRTRRAQHVVWIGVDGWGAYAFRDSFNCEMKNIRQLMSEGAWTIKARTVMPSVSGPNWGAMFSSALPCMNGIVDNSNGPAVPAVTTAEHGLFPTIFHVVRQAYPNAEIGVQHEWGTIKYYVDSLDCNHVKHIKGSNVERDTPDEAAKYIKEKKPDLFFIHIDQVDHAGHHDGHHTSKYFDCVNRVDSQIGQIVQAVKDAGIYDDTIIILTSDHGGVGTGHGGNHPDELTVPVVYCGKGVKKNYEIPDVVMQFDVASTIADIFGIQDPQAWRGKATQIFEKK
ncbi:MAG: alkaline phosphatase [Bacteroidaceae bacterium]|nr:alkaline phosphatase [Bacteroidaceae bacterium]